MYLGYRRYKHNISYIIMHHYSLLPNRTRWVSRDCWTPQKIIASVCSDVAYSWRVVRSHGWHHRACYTVPCWWHLDHFRLHEYALCMCDGGSGFTCKYLHYQRWVEGGGGWGWDYGRKNIYMHLPTLPKLSGMEGGGNCEPSNTLVTANLCFTRPKEIMWITVD